MPTITKTMARGAATTNTGTTLYTVPASTTAVVTNIVVANTAASSGTFTLALDSVALFSAVSIAANTTVAIDLKQNLTTTKTITGGASAITVSLHISGVEIS